MGALSTFAATAFPIVLLFLAGIALLGIRRFEAPWWILAAVAFVTLGVWGWLYLEDMARLWSGQSRIQTTIGAEAIAAGVFVLVKHRSWLGVHGRTRGLARVRKGSHAKR